MRTKTILLTAAVVAAGALSSQAQNVFSQNVVGYVQQVFNANQFYLVSNPLDNGTNTLTSLIPTAPNASSVQIWNGSGYTIYSFLPPGQWKLGGVASNPVIPPSTGFFLKYGAGFGATVTNTFLGNVSVAIGASGTNSLPAGFSLVGSAIPYADAVTNSSTINLHVSFGTSLQKWNSANNGGAGGFDIYSYLPNGGGQWRLGGVSNTPSIGVAEGFFINPNGATNWVETLPAM